jgi:hypothetical protein
MWGNIEVESFIEWLREGIGQLKRPWYARRVGGAAVRVGEPLCSPYYAAPLKPSGAGKWSSGLPVWEVTTVSERGTGENVRSSVIAASDAYRMVLRRIGEGLGRP